ncbi:hypothetical protein LUTEI9C_60213 [Luteimonas sp. 9C]|nr:hypothetical protein LUTEI9C_60213 [Luteimonas sp. 9C]
MGRHRHGGRGGRRHPALRRIGAAAAAVLRLAGARRGGRAQADRLKVLGGACVVSAGGRG